MIRILLSTLCLSAMFLATAYAQPQDWPNLNPDDQLFADKHFVISNIHPNPSFGQVSFEYEFAEMPKGTYKIIFHNVLGAQVAVYDVPYGSKNLKVSLDHLKPGVYFYSLVIDDKKKVTKKFMIK